MAKEKMTIIEHLIELRRRLISIVIIVLLLAMVALYFADELLTIVLKPASDIQLIFIAPSEAFLANVKLAITSAVIVSFPHILYQVLAYILPAFKKQKKRYLILFFLTIITLFLLGISFAYFVVSPIAIAFFLGFARSDLQASITISSYLNFITNMVFAFGFVFQIPIIFMLLGKMRLVKSKFLRKNWKYAVLIITIISAIITPPDVFSQFLMIVPLLLLFEVSILLVKTTEKGS